MVESAILSANRRDGARATGWMSFTHAFALVIFPPLMPEKRQTLPPERLREVLDRLNQVLSEAERLRDEI